MARRTARLSLDALQPYLVEMRDRAPGPLGWHDLFGNDHAVEIEIGCGKGSFLIAIAQAYPETNFFGIEIERAFQLYAANRVAKRALRNVRLACADARSLFHDFLGDRCLQAIHIYFPDPWWKNRHRKRRLFTAEFAADCARTLVAGGKLHIASDVARYFAEIESVLAGQGKLRKVPEQSLEEARREYLTNFERKYQEQGRPIYRALYELAAT